MSIAAAIVRLATCEGTADDVADLLAEAERLGLERIWVQVSRSRAQFPLRRGQRARLLGRHGGPPSSRDRDLVAIARQYVGGWWDLHEVRLWLRQHVEPKRPPTRSPWRDGRGIVPRGARE